MRRAISVRIAAAVLFLSCTWVAYTQTPTPAKPRPATAKQVKDNLYLIQGEGGNVAAYVTDEQHRRRAKRPATLGKLFRCRS